MPTDDIHILKDEIPEQEEPKGVWVIVDYNYDQYISEVHQTEIGALRVINQRGYGSVRFLEWGKTLSD